MSTTGHAVLVVPVPELEAAIVDRIRHYDQSFLSPDPAFVHAHITLLAPFLAEPTAEDVATVGKIAAAADPFDFTLSALRTFAGGTIYLDPEPSAPFAALTAELVTAFPQCPPYDGLFDPVPHLTVDHRAGGVSVADARALLGDTVPARCRADRIDLQWYANHGCRLLASWTLGKTV